ncbi:polyphosphate kinase [Yersinia kristensenii]|nr:polyphosphate kinase [Yersinia kristensenii ATCC 33638]PEH53450.1 polyphosphate kinase [Yersinia kristensenii]
MHMLSKDKLKYPTEITDEQLRYLITAFENNMTEFYPVGREAEIARQLLSLRERVAILELEPTYNGMTAQELFAHSKELAQQLAALKQQKPTGQVISCNGNKTLGWINDAPEGTLLFTAAKPAEIPRHIYSMLVNELRDIPAIGCKRELIISVLNRHGVIAEPVQCDPPATE